MFYELAGVVGGGIEESFEEEVGVEEIAGTFGTRDAARREEWLRAGSPLRAGISKKETERAPTGSPSRTSQRYKWVDDNGRARGLASRVRKTMKRSPRTLRLRSGQEAAATKDQAWLAASDGRGKRTRDGKGKRKTRRKRKTRG